MTGLPADDWIFRDELFVPLVAVAPYDTLDEALALANDTDLGLTAGFFSADPGEIDEFLDEIQAGVVYVNRAAGRDDRGVARGAAVRRLEGLWHRRQGRRRPLLRAAVPARTVKDGGFLT